MRWWQWLLAWVALSVLVAPLLGRWLRYIAETQTRPWGEE
jgi:hypothetical protein